MMRQLYFVTDEILNLIVNKKSRELNIVVYICYLQIFIWIGKGSNDFERKESMKTANVRLLKDPLISCVAGVDFEQGFEESCLFGCFKDQLGKDTENKIIKKQ